MQRFYYDVAKKHLEYESPVDDEGRPHGLAKYYDSRGNLKQQIEFSHGEAHGSFKRYNPKGEVIEEFTYAHNVLDGLYVRKDKKHPHVQLYREGVVILDAQPELTPSDVVLWLRKYREVYFHNSLRANIVDGLERNLENSDESK